MLSALFPLHLHLSLHKEGCQLMQDETIFPTKLLIAIK